MKFKYIFLSAWLLSAAVACKKIEIKPTGQVPPELALKNETDLKATLNSCYTPLRGDAYYGGRVQIVSELMADVMDGSNLTGEYLVINRFNSGGGTGTSGALYNEPYVVVQRANVVLANLGLVTSSDAARKDVEGQARFMRAFSMFEMVKLFAQPYGFRADNSHLGLVIKTSADLQTGLPRNTVRQVYDAIIDDLKAAETLLPNVNGNYPGALAAKAVLARVYFQMNDFANAYNYANQVITAGTYTFDNTANYVNNRFNAVKTTEAVWWLVNEKSFNPTLGENFGGMRNIGNNDTTLSLGVPITKSAYDLGTANVNDRRRQWYKDSLLASGSRRYSITKYKNPLFVLPVIHITELKLIRAESAAELNQNLPVAIADINDITQRAYGGAVADLAGNATASAIRARVRSERRLEMVFETGDRLQQIKRIGAKGESSFSRTAAWNCNGMVLQFPANEVSVNINFVQNPTGGCN